MRVLRDIRMRMLIDMRTVTLDTLAKDLHESSPDIKEGNVVDFV